MGDKAQSMLTEAQREFLRGESNPSNPSVYKGRIQERIYNTFREDAAILLEEVSPEDRREIFRYWQDEEVDDLRGKDAFAEEYYDATMEWAEKGSLEINLPKMLAFLYLGVEETGLSSFEEVLESAMKSVAKERGEYMSEFEFSVDFKKRATAEDIFNAVEEGEIDVGSLQTTQFHKLIQSDTVDWRDLPDDQVAEIGKFMSLSE